MERSHDDRERNHDGPERLSGVELCSSYRIRRFFAAVGPLFVIFIVDIGRRLSWGAFGFLVFFSAGYSAFVGLFFVTRWKLTKAIEQRLPVRSINVAMWSSLILMGIVASIPYLFALVGPTGLDPHEKGL